MPDPDDLQSRLAAMARRRVDSSDHAAPLAAGSRRRIRRGERLGAALAAMVVVALVAGGVALARSGQEQGTTVRVGETPAATCYPPGIPQVVATDLRQLARAGQAVPGATPKAMAAALPTADSPNVTIDLKAFGGGWDLIITGLHFAPWGMGPNGIDPDPGSDNGESVLLGPDLQFKGAASVAVPEDLASLDPIAVSLDPSCDHSDVGTSETSSSTTVLVNPFAPVSSTSTTATGAGPPSSSLGNKVGWPACVGSQVSLTATTDRSTYAAGDPVKVTVTIRNNGPTCENNSPVDLIDSCPQFQVIDSSGKVAYQPLVACPQPLTIGPVDAGYSRSVSFSWPASVPTGAYVVTPSAPEFNGLVVHASTIHIT
jgi:hypothetical protein